MANLTDDQRSDLIIGGAQEAAIIYGNYLDPFVMKGLKEALGPMMDVAEIGQYFSNGNYNAAATSAQTAAGGAFLWPGLSSAIQGASSNPVVRSVLMIIGGAATAAGAGSIWGNTSSPMQAPDRIATMGADPDLYSLVYRAVAIGVPPQLLEDLARRNNDDLRTLLNGLEEKGLLQQGRAIHCFTADALIATSLTTSTRIAHLRLGDVVLAFDPCTDNGRGGLVPRRVTRLYSNTTTEWVKLEWRDPVTGITVTGNYGNYGDSPLNYANYGDELR